MSDPHDDTDMSPEEFEERMANGIPAAVSPSAPRVFWVSASPNNGGGTIQRVVAITGQLASIATTNP